MKDAIDLYKQHLQAKQNKAGSIEQTIYRLGDFFSDPEFPLGLMTQKQCAGYYQAMVDRVLDEKTGRTMAATTHRNRLAEAKSFLRWCLEQGWIRESPLAKVEKVGKNKHGKPQLRIDEARLWLKAAYDAADSGSPGAVAAMMTLLLGLRASEVVTRCARDVDDGGKILWVDASGAWTPKSEAGRRRLNIPYKLRPYLQRLAKGKDGAALIFGKHWRDWPRHQVMAICKAAGVPEVSAHGMRGLWATLAVEVGTPNLAVAAALGHESFRTTKRSYAKGSAVEKAKQARFLQAIQGGKR